MSVHGILLFLLCVVQLAWTDSANAQRPTPAANQSAPVLLEFEGKVEVSRAGSQVWDPAYTNQVLRANDRVRTGPRSRAVIRWSDRTMARMDAQSIFMVPEQPGRWNPFRLLRGLLYFLHRDEPGEFPVETPTAYAVVVGTEFTVEVADNGTTTVRLLDGAVNLTNQFGQLQLNTGEAGITEPGKPPARTAAINAVQAVQWCLYYPGVLDLDELRLNTTTTKELKDSLAAYRAGDLLAAVAAYPAERQPGSGTEAIYLAALLLGVGQVSEAENLLHSNRTSTSLAESNRVTRLKAALSKLIQTVSAAGPVRGQSVSVREPPGSAEESIEGKSATEWLVKSYVEQAGSRLEGALRFARYAVEVAPEFGFGWERVAELEFSFGHIEEAREALAKSIRLAPRNAQAFALKGFLFAAENRIPAAITEFNRAIALDGALGNAWLGRGLCRIRQGHLLEGREDLLTAATVEPQRAVLRSYLGKAFNETEDIRRARHELALARNFDPNDPTSWLYSALLNQQDNRINEAVRDLEQSQALNDNREVYRSGLLLDQDRAVRGANLANIFQDANMPEVATREAVRAVNADYANYSAHLFLANSYDALRDPNQANQRYETPWLSEYLVANLLAPVGAGTLSQSVSQQEYSRLFEHNRLGVVSRTEYLSRGDWLQSGAQYGVLDNFAYALDGYYRSRNGQTPNNDLEQLSLSLQTKVQLTPSDSAYLQAIYYNADGGDLAQHYDPNQVNRRVRVEESQEPLLLAGYHHEWRPGVQTLMLVGRLEDSFAVHNRDHSSLVLDTFGGTVAAVYPLVAEQRYFNDLEIYTGEIQQIYQAGEHTWIAGARGQAGEYDSRNRDTNGPNDQFLVPERQGGVSDFARANVYGYWNWQMLPSLQLVGGLSYDWLKYPENWLFAPLTTPREKTTDQVSPKGGIIWTPLAKTTVRAGYAQSLGGVTFDQSFQLEPTQVAGFNQAWRSLIPESVGDVNSAATFENVGLSVEQKIGRGTFLGASAQLLESEVRRSVGVYEAPSSIEPLLPATTPQNLQYSEREFAVTWNQLLSDEWSLGARYRVSQAELQSHYTQIPATVSVDPTSSFRPREEQEAVLQQINLFVLYTHSCGFFAQFDSLWNHQENDGYTPALPGDDFWQFNAMVGYRFLKRRVEARLGLLNITDQDYRLNPLNLTAELPRERTLMASLRLSF